MQCRVSVYRYSSQQLSRSLLSHRGPLSFHQERREDTPKDRTSLSCRDATILLVFSTVTLPGRSLLFNYPMCYYLYLWKTPQIQRQLRKTFQPTHSSVHSRYWREEEKKLQNAPTWGEMNVGRLSASPRSLICAGSLQTSPGWPWRKLRRMGAYWYPRKSNTCFSRAVIWRGGWGAGRRFRAPDDDSPCQPRRRCPGLYLSHKVVFFIPGSCHSNWAAGDQAGGGLRDPIMLNYILMKGSGVGNRGGGRAERAALRSLVSICS